MIIKDIDTIIDVFRRELRNHYSNIRINRFDYGASFFCRNQYDVDDEYSLSIEISIPNQTVTFDSRAYGYKQIRLEQAQRDGKTIIRQATIGTEQYNGPIRLV